MTALLTFLRSWRDWVDAGAPEEAPYTRRHGLCNNVGRFDRSTYADYGEGLAALEKALEVEFVDPYYPFAHHEEYLKRRNEGTQHTCPVRLAWVDAKIKELEDAAAV